MSGAEDAIRRAHDRAVAAGEPGYLDPASGAFVFTAAVLADRGETPWLRLPALPVPDRREMDGPDRNGDDAASGLTDDQEPWSPSA